MGIPGSANLMLLGGGAQGYEIEQSLRFDNTSAAHLTRTLSASGNRRTFTLSWWLKRGKLNNGTCGPWVWQGANGYESFGIYFADEAFRVVSNVEAVSNVFDKKTAALYRDPSAWMHIVVAIDTTLATADDRVKIYINGEQITDFSSNNNPSQNHQMKWNDSSLTQRWVRQNSGHFDGCQAEIHHVDGTALDATTFGEYDSNGVWRPIEVDLTTAEYGAQGFYLDFSDPDDLGADRSGNGNDWTLNNFIYEVGTPDYADNWIGSTSGSYYSGSWENVFNGNVTAYTDYVYAYTNTATLTFSTALSGVIEVFGSDGGNGDANSGYIALSDGSSWSINSVARANAQWHSFGSKSNITSITVSGTSNGHGALLGAIRVDGHLLANNSAKLNYDNSSDTPTTNWATLNSAIRQYSSSIENISDGNLQIANTGSGVTGSGWATIPVDGSGKWYFEARPIVATGSIWIGFGDSAHQAGLGTYSAALRDNGYTYKSNGNKCSDSSTGVSYGASYGVGDVIGVALNLEDDEITFYKNGTSQGTAFTSIFSSGGFFAGCSVDPSATVVLNFGQRAFEYTPPTGFKALNTSNIAAPTIKDGSQNTMPVLWTGTGTARTQTGYNFQPDLLWIMRRDASGMNVRLYDVVRGDNGTVMYRLGTNNNVKQDVDGDVTGLTSTGFTIGNDGTDHPNVNGTSYVGWGWKAGGSVSADNNTAGSADATVSASPSSGFSIVKFTGTGSALTVGHGLGVAPGLLIAKNMDKDDEWVVWFNAFDMDDYVYLNRSFAKATTTNADTFWNNTAPTDTLVSIGPNTNTNNSGDNIIMYCFAEIEGYCKIGTYQGNGSTDGAFVWCGFRPSTILIKGYHSSNWRIMDTKRDGYNAKNDYLRPNETDGEAASNFDILSNGFKLRNTDSEANSSNTFAFIAWAENPFGGSGASPATAR